MTKRGSQKNHHTRSQEYLRLFAIEFHWSSDERGFPHCLAGTHLSEDKWLEITIAGGLSHPTVWHCAARNQGGTLPPSGRRRTSLLT